MPRRKTTKKETTAKNILKTEVYSLRGEVVGKTSLPADIFNTKVSSFLLAQAVRVYQANQRIGTHATKTRAQVAGSTRKIFRQKGTGRARHGAITAPIFIGGGVAHGPHPKDYSLELPQKMKRQALFGALTSKLQNRELKVVRGLEKIEIKTKKMFDTLTNLKLPIEKESILLVTAQNLRNVLLAGRNIQNLSIENAKLLNAYEVLSSKNLLLMEDAVPVLANHFLSLKQEMKTPKISSSPSPLPDKTDKNKSPKKKVKVSAKPKKISRPKKTTKRKKV